MPAPTPRPAYQLKIGQFIVNSEARRDAKGRLAIYKLPKGDGGGTYEVAGINDRYHPRIAEHLRELITLGKHDVAENLAIEYICSYTDLVASWNRWSCVEAYLRDCAFNRGPGGAAKIYQIALGVVVDGHIGPKTLAVANDLDDRRAFLKALRAARETYERIIAPPVGPRAKFWKGLISRWDKALAFAEGLA
jgi:hypothetical protein